MQRPETKAVYSVMPVGEKARYVPFSKERLVLARVVCVGVESYCEEYLYH